MTLLTVEEIDAKLEQARACEMKAWNGNQSQVALRYRDVVDQLLDLRWAAAEQGAVSG